MEYSFVVQPGADPRRIRLRYRGSSSVTLDASGGLEVRTAAGALREEPPYAFQEAGGRREKVAAAYALRRDRGDFLYAFKLGPYDRRRALVIDPVVLAYCGYIGGGGEDFGLSIAVDAAGNAYVAGSTESSEATFPVTVGPDLMFNGGSRDVFVARVKADGTGLDYAGYIGGSGDEWGRGIAVDVAGNAYVTGVTASTEGTFPVTVGPDLTYNGLRDAFVAKVKADGTGFDYAGYIGGDDGDDGFGIAVDLGGNAYVTGETRSAEATFPVTVGPDLTFNGGPFDADAFVAKVKADGTGLDYAGYIGGSSEESRLGIAVDTVGSAYIAGRTGSTEVTFPVTVGPDLTFNGGSWDAFVAKVKADGTGLDYAGYIGGSDDDESGSIAVGATANAYVAGYTLSSEATFPVTVGPDLTSNGGYDAFVAKVKADGTGLDYAGYIGGSGYEDSSGVAVDSAGKAYVSGSTPSSEATFPVAIGPDLTHNGGYDAFVAKVKADGAGLEYAGYIGGSGDDSRLGIAVDAAANAYVAGYTGSRDATFPVTVGPDLTFNGDRTDAFVAKVIVTSCLVGTLLPPPALRGVKAGAAASFDWAPDPAALEYHLNTVTTKTFLRETDPTSPHQAPRGQGETQCTTSGLSCPDGDALVDPRALLFYQVFSACGPTGADEGPVCTAAAPCP